MAANTSKYLMQCLPSWVENYPKCNLGESFLLIDFYDLQGGKHLNTDPMFIISLRGGSSLLTMMENELDS